MCQSIISAQCMVIRVQACTFLPASINFLSGLFNIVIIATIKTDPQSPNSQYKSPTSAKFSLSSMAAFKLCFLFVPQL